MASVVINELATASPPLVDVTIQIEEGLRPILARIELTGAARTRSSLVNHLTGLVPQEPLLNFDPDRIRAGLERAGIFERVEAVELYAEGDSAIVLYAQVKEASPGAFDLALGYERSDGDAGALVGSGNLVLRNVFGQGRLLRLALYRSPGQISKINVRVVDPYLLGLPLSLALQFNGLQQDSTFGKRDYGLELGYQIEQSTEIFALLTREVTRPGPEWVNTSGRTTTHSSRNSDVCRCWCPDS